MSSIKKYVGLGVVLFFVPLRANLDTTTGPNLNQTITLSTNFTFTNFELARGNVRFKNGFTIPSGLTATIDVQTPISGTLNILDLATLNLAGDLHLAPGSVINAPSGIIQLNGHTIYCQGDLVTPISFDFSNSFNLICIAIPSGTLDGQGHDFKITTTVEKLRLNNSNVTGQPDASTHFTLRNIRLASAAGAQFFDTPYVYNFDNVTMHLIQIITNAPTNLNFYGNFSMIANVGTYIQFAGPPTFHSGSNVYIAPGILFGAGDFNTDPIFQDKSAVLHFNNGTFSWFNNVNTVSLTTGSVIIEGSVVFQRSGVFGGVPAYMVIGNGNPSNDLDLYILPGATLTIPSPSDNTNNHTNALVYANSV